LIARFYRRAFRLTLAESESEIYRERLTGFIDAARRRVRVAVHLPNRTIVLKRGTSSHGHFRGIVRAIPEDLVDNTWHPVDHEWVDCRATTSESRDPGEGRLRLIPEQGVSVISDIDDTIRSSHVGQRRRLIESTFLHPYQPVQGMAEVYRAWEQTGASFHYVSSSPWQLYRPLRMFMAAEGFPLGSFHLRAMRWRDPSILQLVIAKKRSKTRAIHTLVKWFPRRRFVLVGDAGERDPELYAAISRRYPNQVSKILIRQVPGTPINLRRIDRAFFDIPRSRWMIFSDPRELLHVHPIPVLTNG
jgi:phosphatidate phosphatase APP1